MAMSGGGTDGMKNEINVTPMIDVLLVLLIIFIMIIPLGRKVLEVLPDNQYAINKAPYTKESLFQGISDIYKDRPEKIMFVRGDATVKYQDVIFAIDAARGAGVKVIGVTPKPKAEKAP
jgi:biopolymer transport protein ExbD